MVQEVYGRERPYRGGLEGRVGSSNNSGTWKREAEIPGPHEKPGFDFEAGFLVII